jgi:hypothetical protein
MILALSHGDFLCFVRFFLFFVLQPGSSDQAFRRPHLFSEPGIDHESRPSNFLAVVAVAYHRPLRFAGNLVLNPSAEAATCRGQFGVVALGRHDF